jgi:hypothetical protein
LGTLFNNVLNLEGGAGRAAVYAIGLLALFATLRSMSETFIYFYILFGWVVIVKMLKQMRRRFYRTMPRRLPRH